MQITVRLFATLRQIAGWKEKSFELPDGATLGELLTQMTTVQPELDLNRRVTYAAVNEEYAKLSDSLKSGDTVAIFPPVSGGAESIADRGKKLFEIVEAPISLDDVASRVTRPDCGAVVVFSGTVRGETKTGEGQRSTDFLVYEAYVAMAEQMMAKIGKEVQERWPLVYSISIVHRIGRIEVEEPSVVIAVSTPHRGDGCFDACRYAIERLKAIVPIWKQENWSDGQVWVEGPRQPELDLSAPGQ
ncbi:MAG: molybdopterin converting factor subunit 1 [Caldilineaceae bacterium]